MDKTTIRKIAMKSGTRLRPSAQKDQDKLAELGIPIDARLFFAEAEPEQCVEINHVRLWPIKEVLAENRDYVPGCFIRPMGYIVFATTIFGDAYCFDIKKKNAESAPIVLVAHDLNWDEIKPEGMAELAKPIASTFENYLKLFVEEKLDIEPNYPEFNP